MSHFVNSTDFIIPIKVDDTGRLEQHLQTSGVWERRAPEHTHYLFPYAARVFQDPGCCRIYTCKDAAALPVNVSFAKLGLSSLPELTSLVLNVFSTGVAFLEVLVQYRADMPVEEIINFSNKFKDAFTKSEEPESRPLAAVVNDLIPEHCGAEPFFTSRNAAEFRRRCLVYHMLYLPEEQDEQKIANDAFLLKRGYSMAFAAMPGDDTGSYDMCYTPYTYQHWGGSPEGLVCLCTAPPENARHYIETFHYQQLMNDYRYMYLLLLNQRFSAIAYLDDVVAYKEDDEIGDLYTKVLTLKTQYAFRIISDDMLYQNVYKRMYRILDIDSLLEDLDDISGKFDTLRAKYDQQSGRKMDVMLICLSVLTVFSSLIDAAGYFERLHFSATLATVCSLLPPAALLLFIAWKAIKAKR